MSAAELRKAAETLRRDYPVGEFCPDDCNCDADLDYHPSAEIWQELAAWLDQCADRLDRGHHNGSRHSHRIARLINGGASDA